MKKLTYNWDKLLQEAYELAVKYAAAPPEETVHIVVDADDEGSLSVDTCYDCYGTHGEIVHTITGQRSGGAKKWDIVDWQSDDIEKITGLKEEDLYSKIRKEYDLDEEEDVDDYIEDYIDDNFSDEFDEWADQEVRDVWGTEIRSTIEDGLADAIAALEKEDEEND